MNPEEYEVLRRLLAQLVQIRGVSKDPEAEALIQEAVVQQPDATYLLTERVLLLSVALDRARARTAELETEVLRSRSDYVGSSATREPSAAPSADLPPPGAAAASAFAIAPGFGDD